VPEVVQDALIEAAEAQVAQVVRRLHHSGAQVSSIIRLGHPAEEILTIAQEQNTALIVLGARGQTRAEPFPLGGVTQKVVKYATCSVLVVRT
jgi:nucleotide-binding universal stress UspA family protein